MAKASKSTETVDPKTASGDFTPRPDKSNAEAPDGSAAAAGQQQLEAIQNSEDNKKTLAKASQVAKTNATETKAAPRSRPAKSARRR